VSAVNWDILAAKPGRGNEVFFTLPMSRFCRALREIRKVKSRHRSNSEKRQNSRKQSCKARVPLPSSVKKPPPPIVLGFLCPWYREHVRIDFGVHFLDRGRRFDSGDMPLSMSHPGLPRRRYPPASATSSPAAHALARQEIHGSLIVQLPEIVDQPFPLAGLRVDVRVELNQVFRQVEPLLMECVLERRAVRCCQPSWLGGGVLNRVIGIGPPLR
jgi:hypothetical protein